MSKNQNGQNGGLPVEKSYNGYVPPAMITAFSWELAGLDHGTATLTAHIRDGELTRFTTGRERSHVVEGGNGGE